MDNADKFTASINIDDLRLWMEDDVKKKYIHIKYKI